MSETKSVRRHKVCKVHKPILAGGEMVCGVCGAVDAEQTAMLREQMNGSEVAHMLASTMQVADGVLVRNLGSQHGYVSQGNVGLAFRLGNPRAKDFQGKRCAPTLQDGYGVGQYIDRRGYWTEKNGKAKFKVDYTQDKWLIQVSQAAYNLAAEMGLSPTIRGQLGIETKRIYSRLIIGLMAYIVPRMALANLDYPGIDRRFAEENKVALEELKADILKQLNMNCRSIDALLQRVAYQERTITTSLNQPVFELGTPISS